MKHDLSHCRGVYWESPLHEEEEKEVYCPQCKSYGELYIDALTGNIQTLDNECTFIEYYKDWCDICNGTGLITEQYLNR